MKESSVNKLKLIMDLVIPELERMDGSENEKLVQILELHEEILLEEGVIAENKRLQCKDCGYWGGITAFWGQCSKQKPGGSGGVNKVTEAYNYCNLKIENIKEESENE